MAATYDPNLATRKDRVRFYLGDTNVAQALIQDETIDVLLAETGATPLSVAAFLAQGIVAQFAQQVDFDVDGQGEKRSALLKNYRTVAADLATRAADEKAGNADQGVVDAMSAMGGGIMVGGISVRKNVAKSEDRDRAANYSPLYGYGLDEEC